MPNPGNGQRRELWSWHAEQLPLLAYNIISTPWGSGVSRTNSMRKVERKRITQKPPWRSIYSAYGAPLATIGCEACVQLDHRAQRRSSGRASQRMPVGRNHQMGKRAKALHTVGSPANMMAHGATTSFRDETYLRLTGPPFLMHRLLTNPAFFGGVRLLGMDFRSGR
jgi:hypothetical protein